MNGPEAVAAFMFFGGTFWVLRPVAAAVAKRIAGEHRKPGMEPAERDEILSELQQVREEVAELAERMDFAERLPSKQSEVNRCSLSQDHRFTSLCLEGSRSPKALRSASSATSPPTTRSPHNISARAAG